MTVLGMPVLDRSIRLVEMFLENLLEQIQGFINSLPVQVIAEVTLHLEMRPIWFFKSPSNPAHSENCPVHPGPLEVLFKQVQPVQSMAI